MYTGVATILGAQIQVAQRRGSPHDMLEYSTVWEAINKKEESTLAGSKGMWVIKPYTYQDTRDIKVSCICIGNGGHRLRLDGNISIPSFQPREHYATDTGLFNQIPFVAKPIEADLSPADRARFCLRRTAIINGKLHVLYYGRVLDAVTIPNATTTKRIITNNAGTTSDISTEWVPTSADLTPAMTDRSPSGTTEQVYVSSAIRDEIIFTEQDVQNLKEACALLYGNEAYAFISEIAVCTGVRRAIEKAYDNNGSSQIPVQGAFDYAGVQIVSFSYAEYSMAAYPTGFKLGINTAVSEPLMGRED